MKRLQTTTRITHSRSRAPLTSTRTAATLVEVLMALLIMGVGVISVFALFPIALLRAVQATNQTNARILKADVEEDLYNRPDLLNRHLPPGGAGVPSFRGEWAPRTNYTRGDIVYPAVRPGSALPEPNLWYFCTDTQDSTGTSLPAGTPATSGPVAPAWQTAGVTNDISPNGMQLTIWRPLPLMHLQPNQSPYNDPANVIGNASPLYSTRRYVVDPLGWANAQADNTTFQRPYEFGNKTNVTDATGFSPTPASPADFNLLRINGALNTPAAAVFGTTLPDSWEPLVQATPSDFNPKPTGPQPVTTSVTFPQTVNLDGLRQIYTDLQDQATTPLGIISVPPRIVLTTADGALSETRFLDPTAGALNNRVSWSASNPLPAAFVARDIGQARIETFDRRYTWFMTVNKDSSGRADTKVVVVFNRKFLPEEEHVYNANFGNTNLDIDSDGAQDVFNSSQVRINWTPGMEPDPLLQPGNFLFDARNVEWYRIQQVNVNDQVNGDALLTLDRTAITTPDDGMGNPVPGPGRVILMRGIIDVFDL